ncbi:5'/3'-nucleotidase SurE [Acidobacteriota bacterium]
MRKKGLTSLFILGLFAFVITFLSLCSTQKEQETWFKRVLITNDDGIDSPGITELAQAFSKVAETYVVAPNQNKSGSGDYMSVFSKGKITIEKRDMGEGIQAYAVDGFPADCVLIALKGIMKDNPPDVVISGINTGANLDWAWIASGTVGAARIAGFAGIPAIAVSGVDDDIPGALAAASHWVVRLAQSPSIQELADYQYVTADIPNIRPDEIQGVHVTQRAGLRPEFNFEKADTPEGADGSEQEVWRMTGIRGTGAAPPDDSDLAFYRKGYIVIVPMKADEHDYKLLDKFKLDLSIFPSWEK